MFLANVLTTWVEALGLILNDENPNENLRGIPILTDFPLTEVEYPGLWVNFAVQGDVRNVGIGHIEYEHDDQGDLHQVYRWQFGGLVEIAVAAMGNLERALLVDAIASAFAVARVDENYEGNLRKHVERGDLVGMNVVWESFTIGGFAETPGTPWQTDDVVYEATISMELEGEVVIDPATGSLVPLAAIVITPIGPEDQAVPLPTTGQDGWV